MELKTLKDFDDGNLRRSEEILLENVRQEAIKLLKKLDITKGAIMFGHKGLHWDDNDKERDYGTASKETLIMATKHFFNITEEDLK